MSKIRFARLQYVTGFQLVTNLIKRVGREETDAESAAVSKADDDIAHVH
jgi:hypothetical protein